MKPAALISVSDRSGLIEFAKELNALGYVCLATSGTRAYLLENKCDCESIEEYTGQKEILDGRVKTLHPKIHAGILAKRSDPKHLKELADNEIYQIDIAVVNLYPFLAKIAEGIKDVKTLTEFIDIGGPTMIRAAAKNHLGVIPLIDPADYPRVLESLKSKAGVAESLRRELASKVFVTMAHYDLSVAGALAADETSNEKFGKYEGVVLEQKQSLRYGENPSQSAAFYTSLHQSTLPWKQLGGKELSYNNLLDFDAARRLIQDFPEHKATAVIIKHLNPCGVATAPILKAALLKAKLSDPRSHFGGVLAFNQEVTSEVAEYIREDFAEIVLAPSYSAEALKILQTSKTLRVIETDLASSNTREIRAAAGGYLLQIADSGVSSLKDAQNPSQRKLSKREAEDLEMAWKICAHVKSNAITIVKDGTLLAVGAGQMSRIDSVEIAISKANRFNHDLAGAVAASDAFFPFPDSIETLAEVGISAIIAPSGAKRDNESVAAADKNEVALLFTSDRHFRH